MNELAARRFPIGLSAYYPNYFLVREDKNLRVVAKKKKRCVFSGSDYRFDPALTASF
jgi:hypothetical protein